MASLTTTNRNRAADAVTVRANGGGSLRLYSGTPPADANAALSGNTLLATLPMSATAFGAAVAGVATANALTAAVAPATGRPTFCRIIESDGTTVVVQLRAVLVWLASTAFSVGDRVSNGANTYVATTAGTSAASGGPTGTGTGIADGSVVWAFEGINEAVLAGASQILSGANVSMSSVTYTQPAG
jgi:hypothetical protein